MFVLSDLRVFSIILALLFFSVCQILAQWNTKDFVKREHSLMKPYLGAGLSMPYWDLLGSTIVTNNYIRLTPDSRSRHGSLWNTVPIQARNWEVQINFKIHGSGGDLFGDGMVIWYAQERMEVGPVFGSKDFFKGLAILIDTYSNHNGEHNHLHPYISAMINNGSLHYDHDRDGTHTQLAGCEAKLRNVDHDTHLSIKYEYNVLTVSIDLEGKAGWKECLTVNGVMLPTGYYLGMSAATGDLSDNHDILSVRFYVLDLPDDPKEDRSGIIPSASHYEPPREHIDDPKPSMSGLKVFLLMLIGMIGLIICVVVGIMIYQKHQENSRKRFY